MAKTKTTITTETRKEIAPRGKGKRNIILDAMKEEVLLGVEKNATKEEVEKAWFKKLISVALKDDHKDSGLCIRLITERGWSALKPSSECVSFEFDKDATPTIQAAQVMDAVSEGHIPPDLGLAFVSGIKSMIDIEANTELKARIEQIEKMLGER